MNWRFCQILFITTCLIIGQSVAENDISEKYTGYIVFELNVTTSQQERFLTYLQDKFAGEMEILNDYGIYGRTLINIDKKHIPEVLDYIPPKVHKTIKYLFTDDAIKVETMGRNFKNFEEHGYTFGKYNSYDQIENYLREVANKNKELIKIRKAALTFENREIFVVHLAKKSSHRKKAIVFECGIHGREWITVELCVYIIRQFAHAGQRRGDERRLLEKYDFIILPVVNPDGFVYSMENDRMWRKNRNPLPRHSDESCVGVDINRNFDIQHCTDQKYQNDSCSHINCGIEPFSEEESRAVRTVVHNNQDRLHAYFSLHSFGSVWGIPYGFIEWKPLDYVELKRVALLGARRVHNVRGTFMKVGSVFQLLDKSSGTSTDYAFIRGKAKYAYVIQMGEFFIVKEEEILAHINEIYKGLLEAMISMETE